MEIYNNVQLSDFKRGLYFKRKSLNFSLFIIVPNLSCSETKRVFKIAPFLKKKF